MKGHLVHLLTKQYKVKHFGIDHDFIMLFFEVKTLVFKCKTYSTMVLLSSDIITVKPKLYIVRAGGTYTLNLFCTDKVATLAQAAVSQYKRN